MKETVEQVLASLDESWSKEAREKILKASRLRYEYATRQRPIWGGLREADEVSLIRLFLKMHLRTDAICAGLLVEAVQREDLTEAEIKETLGKSVAALCMKVVKLPSFPFVEVEAKQQRQKQREEVQTQAESFRRMLLAIAQDLRVVLLYLVVRVHQLRFLGFLPIKEQTPIARECREICAPLANRLGISWLKNELEDLSLRFLFPHSFYGLAARLSSTVKEREDYIEEVQSLLRSFVDEHNIHAEVTGRSKHINSIFRKLQLRHVTFDQLFDITAFRVICETKEQCYQLLGLIHARWTPVPGRFKDYIALPKSNQYQSLHTTVVGPHNKRMEVQIRTFEMHRIAEEGIAAHWLYKESGGSQPQSGGKTDAVQWLRSLLHLQEEKSDAQEFMADVQDHLFEERVFVFTPKGDVKELMYGATPLDFAYAIHTEVGMRCVGAKANGKMVSLRYQLQNGDMVEIKTSPSAKPNRGHLEFARTGRARIKIRSFLRTAQRQQAITLGRNLLEKELPSSHKSLSKLIKGGELLKVAQERGWGTIDELLMQIGYGKIEVKSVINTLFPAPEPAPGDEEVVELLEPPPKTSRGRKSRKRSKNAVLVDGMDDIMVRMARCCNPIPGDPIIGFISRGRGAIIHTAGCPKVQELDPQRQIEVSWDNNQQNKHTVTLRIVTENRPGLLTRISRVFSDREINITSAHCHTAQDEAVNVFQCQIADVEQLRRLSQVLNQIRGVNRVERLRR